MLGRFTPVFQSVGLRVCWGIWYGGIVSIFLLCFFSVLTCSALFYISLIGYSYLESGRRVMELFRIRGFTAIITDNLVGYVLGFTTFTVAILTGAAGIVIEVILTKNNAAFLEDGESYIFGPLPGKGFAFGLSFAVGLWIVSVMMNVVKGAVNTLIVCWADSPAVLEMQHPALTKELADAWSVVFTSGTFSTTTPAVIV